MKKQEMYLLIGVVIGGVLWGSVTTLIENNGLLAIFGLGASCIVMGVGLGMTINADKKHD